MVMQPGLNLDLIALPDPFYEIEAVRRIELSFGLSPRRGPRILILHNSQQIILIDALSAGPKVRLTTPITQFIELGPRRRRH